MREPFLINPPGRRSRKRGRKRGFSIGKEGSKHRPTVYTRGGRWVTSKKAKISKPGTYLNPLGETLVTVGANPYRHNRGGRAMAYYGYRGNQVATGMRGAMRVGKWAPLAVTGGLSMVSAGVVPAMLGLTGPWMKLGAQLATAFGGGMLVGNFAGAEHGRVWTIVGVSLVGYDLLKTWVLPQFFPRLAALSDYYYPDYELTESQQVGAFPNEVSDYPDYGGVQAFPEEVSDYPYDGRYASYHS